MGILDDIRESQDPDYGITRGAARLAGRAVGMGSYQAVGGIGSFYGESFKEAGLGFVPQAASSLYGGLGKILGFGKEDSTKVLKRIDTNTDELEAKEDSEIKILKQINSGIFDLNRLVKNNTNKLLENILTKLDDLAPKEEKKKDKNSFLESLLTGLGLALAGLKDTITKIKDALGEVLGLFKNLSKTIASFIDDIIKMAARGPGLFSGLSRLGSLALGASPFLAGPALGAGVIVAQNALKEREDRYAQEGDYKQLRMSLEQNVRQAVTDPNTGITQLSDEDIQRRVDVELESRGYLKDNPKLLEAKKQYDDALRGLDLDKKRMEDSQKAKESRAPLLIDPSLYGTINKSDELAKGLEAEAEKERAAAKAQEKFIPSLPSEVTDLLINNLKSSEQSNSVQGDETATGEPLSKEEILDVLKEFKGQTSVNADEFRLKASEKYGDRSLKLFEDTLRELNGGAQIVPVPVPSPVGPQSMVAPSTGPITNRSNDPGSATRSNAWEGMLSGASIPLIPGSMFA